MYVLSRGSSLTACSRLGQSFKLQLTTPTGSLQCSVHVIRPFKPPGHVLSYSTYSTTLSYNGSLTPPHDCVRLMRELEPSLHVALYMPYCTVLPLFCT